MDRELNRCALENVKNHIIVKMNSLEKAEKQAIAEGRIQSQIDMYHDELCLYAGFLAQLKLLEVNNCGIHKESN